MAQVQSKNRATSDPAERKRVLDEIEKRGIDDVLLWFTDLEGHLKSFSITRSEVEGALDDGMGFDGSSITGFNAIEESDMIAIPDPGTFRVLPDGEAGRMICDVVTPDGNPYDGDPRYALRRALERMKSMGFDTFNVGPEAEYFLFKDEHGTETLDAGGYFAQTTLDAATGVRRDTIRALESMGIPVEYHHHEVGPSQHEIDIRYASALDMADYMLTYRLVVKEVAKQHGYHATFMPKPLFGENGSGMHTHQSLFSGGRNAFFDEKDPWHLSEAGKAFIAGQLRHAREIAAIFAQWVNSYKRQSRVHPARVPSARQRLQPLPRLRRDAGGRPPGDRAGLRAAGPDGDEPLPPDARPAGGARDRLAPRDARRGDPRAVAVGGRAQGARPAHLRPLRRAQAEGVGRVPRPAHRLGDEEVPGGAVARRR
jgi:glutamine synthetase